MAVSRADSATVENSFRPYQAYLALNQYPLTRSVYILLNDPKSGLPSGLTSFLTDFRGQRIILKSGLVPATAPVRIVDAKKKNHEEISINRDELVPGCNHVGTEIAG